MKHTLGTLFLLSTAMSLPPTVEFTSPHHNAPQHSIEQSAAAFGHQVYEDAWFKNYVFDVQDESGKWHHECYMMRNNNIDDVTTLSCKDYSEES